MTLDDPEQRRLVGYSMVPAKNCVGKNVKSLSESLNQTVYLDFTISGSAKAGFWAIAKAAIETGFSITKGKSISRTFEFSVEALPSTNLVYSIAWYDVWRSGTVSNGTESMSFEIKQSIAYEIKSLEVLAC